MDCLYLFECCISASMVASVSWADFSVCVAILANTVKPLLYDHPQNHIGVVVLEGWSLVRDSYTNRNHCPSHEMWSYERDVRW